MDDVDTRALAAAVRRLEQPGLVARFGDTLGTPVEHALRLLPEGARGLIGRSAERAIRMALHAALTTLQRPAAGTAMPLAAPRLHTLAGAAAGALGGAFGGAGLIVELPVTTGLMLRSIADVARSEGADLDAPDTRLECVQVFALCGPAAGDDDAVSGYFAVRQALATALSEASAHIARHGLQAEGAPALVRLLMAIAGRYSIVISEKAAAQLVPVAGAVGGAAINTLFMDHYQGLARGHFVVRRLERRYGADVVTRAYEDCRRNLGQVRR